MALSKLKWNNRGFTWGATTDIYLPVRWASILSNAAWYIESQGSYRQAEEAGRGDEPTGVIGEGENAGERALDYKNLSQAAPGWI